MDEALRHLIDRQAIADLLTDYCRHLDRMELPELVRLFTPDARVIYGPDPRLASEGRAGLEASLARMWRWRRTAHLLANIRVWFDGTAAAWADSDVLAWHERPDGSSATLYGRYHDRLYRMEEGWRIAERRMEMNGSDRGFTVPIPQAARRPPPPGWTPPEGLDLPR
jgi:hypothetical protein